MNGWKGGWGAVYESWGRTGTDHSGGGGLHLLKGGCGAATLMALLWLVGVVVCCIIPSCTDDLTQCLLTVECC